MGEVQKEFPAALSQWKQPFPSPSAGSKPLAQKIFW